MCFPGKGEQMASSTTMTLSTVHSFVIKVYFLKASSIYIWKLSMPGISLTALVHFDRCLSVSSYFHYHLLMLVILCICMLMLSKTINNNMRHKFRRKFCMVLVFILVNVLTANSVLNIFCF